MLFGFITLNILLICMHKTLGAWQFGSRYICDVLPFVFLALLLNKDDKNIEIIDLNKFEVVCMILGIILNIFGVFIMYMH